MTQATICYHCMTPLPEGAARCPHCGAAVDSIENNPNQLAVGTMLAGTCLMGRAAVFVLLVFGLASSVMGCGVTAANASADASNAAATQRPAATMVAAATAKPAATPAPAATSAPIPAETVRKSYEYEDADGGITITRYIGQDTAITIPGNVDGVPVVGIGEYAFSGSEYANVTTFAVC